MKRRLLAQALGIGLTVAPFADSADVSLAALVSTFLGSVVKANPFLRNQLGIKSYLVRDERRAGDRDTLVTVEFASGGTTGSEELIYRILEAELFLTEEKSGLGIAGVARIEWTWGLRRDRLRGIGDGIENYFVLSKKEGAWLSKSDEWARHAFQDVKSHWTREKEGRHEILKAPTQ